MSIDPYKQAQIAWLNLQAVIIKATEQQIVNLQSEIKAQKSYLKALKRQVGTMKECEDGL
jgi:hypothetical protein